MRGKTVVGVGKTNRRAMETEKRLRRCAGSPGPRRGLGGSRGGLRRPELSPESEMVSAKLPSIGRDTARFLAQGRRGRRGGSPGAFSLARGGRRRWGADEIVWLRAFQTFEDKGYAIDNTTLSPELSLMIRKYVLNGQTLAVGNENYKNVIQNCLGIRCIYSPAVKELMWGLKIQMRRFVPKEILEPTNEDRYPMSKGMVFFLNRHNFEVNLDIMVTERIIQMAGVMYECDRCVRKYDISLRLAAEHLMEISQIDTNDWDLLKLATALMMICYPKVNFLTTPQLFPEQLFNRLMQDAPLYKDKIFKIPCLEIYKEIYSAAYEDKQAGKAASDHEIGPDRKKICRGFDLVNGDYCTSRC